MDVLSALFDFSFTEFVTGSLVKFLYGLTVAGVGLVYVIAVIASFAQGAGLGLLMLVVGGVVALLVLTYVRVILEFVMVLFQIHEHTRTIAQQGVLSTPAASSPVAPSTVGVSGASQASRPMMPATTMGTARATIPQGPLLPPLPDEDERGTRRR